MEEKDLMKTDTGLGTIKIADEVVSIIAGLAATEIDGTCRRNCRNARQKKFLQGR